MESTARKPNTLGPLARGSESRSRDTTVLTRPGTAKNTAARRYHAPLRSVSALLNPSPTDLRTSWKVRHRRRVMTLDAIVIAAALGAAQSIRFGVPGISAGLSFDTTFITAFSILLGLGWWCALGLAGSREMFAATAGVDEYRSVITATAWVFGGLALSGLILNMQMARGYLAVALVAGLGGLLVGRVLWRRHVDRLRRNGYYTQQFVIVGSVQSVGTLCRSLARWHPAGFRVIGACVQEPLSRGRIDTALGPIPVLGDYAALDSVLTRSDADAVVIAAAEQLGDARMKRLAWHLESLAIDLIVTPGMTDIAGPRLRVQPIDNVPLFLINHPRRSRASNHGKRCFDIAVAALALFMVLPVLVAISLAIWLSDGRPILFRQERVGQHGRTFRIAKFRTMTVGADAKSSDARTAAGQADAIFYKSANDARVTRIGAFLRRTSLDELPQLFNVLGGSMSIVGPRPLVAGEGTSVAHFVERRSLVKPGITGLWQVSGRSDVSAEERIRLDHSYVDNWSPVQDVVILCRTVGAVLRRRGAY